MYVSGEKEAVTDCARCKESDAWEPRGQDKRIRAGGWTLVSV